MWLTVQRPGHLWLDNCQIGKYQQHPPASSFRCRHVCACLCAVRFDVSCMWYNNAERLNFFVLSPDISVHPFIHKFIRHCLRHCFVFAPKGMDFLFVGPAAGLSLCHKHYVLLILLMENILSRYCEGVSPAWFQWKVRQLLAAFPNLKLRDSHCLIQGLHVQLCKMIAVYMM